MKLYNRSIWYAVLMDLFMGSLALSSANDSTKINSTSVVRLQLQSIADEVVDSAKFDSQGHIAVFVEGEGQRTLAENAFIGSFQKRNYSSVVIDTMSKNQILHVFLFNPEISVRDLNSKFSERNIRSTLEVRIEKGAEREVRMLGTFHRDTKDTVQVSMVELHPAVQKDDEGGILQRMLTPFIVVGGAIVIVYLFFMVRS